MSTPIGLQDNFDDNSLGALWSTFTSNADFTVTEQNQRLELATTVTSNGTARARSASTYNLAAGMHVALELVRPPSLLDNTQFNFEINDPGAPSNRVRITVRSEDDAAALGVRCIATGATTVQDTYDSTAHRWLRIRRSDDGLTIYCEKSPDNRTWTVMAAFTLADLAIASAIGAVQVFIELNNYGTVTSVPQSIWVDNVNQVPTADGVSKLFLGIGLGAMNYT